MEKAQPLFCFRVFSPFGSGVSTHPEKLFEEKETSPLDVFFFSIFIFFSIFSWENISESPLLAMRERARARKAGGWVVRVSGICFWRKIFFKNCIVGPTTIITWYARFFSVEDHQSTYWFSSHDDRVETVNLQRAGWIILYPSRSSSCIPQLRRKW